MILPLRQRHRRMFAGLGVLLPILLIVGIAARKPVPSVARLPIALAGVVPPAGRVVWQRSDLFTNAPVQVELTQRDAGELALILTAERDFVKPDLIVYWSASRPDKILEDAVLLGAFGGGSLPLPNSAHEHDGALILFGLADQEIVAVSKSLRFAANTN